VAAVRSNIVHDLHGVWSRGLAPKLVEFAGVALARAAGQGAAKGLRVAADAVGLRWPMDRSCRRRTRGRLEVGRARGNHDRLRAQRGPGAPAAVRGCVPSQTAPEGDSVLFHVKQSHAPADCPYGKGGSTSLYDADAPGVRLVGYWLAFPQHTTYLVVEADDVAALQAFLKPGAGITTSEITPVSDTPAA
jgi:hypothetical protein